MLSLAQPSTEAANLSREEMLERIVQLQREVAEVQAYPAAHIWQAHRSHSVHTPREDTSCPHHIST